MEHREAKTFADLYRDHAGAVCRFAVYLSGDTALAEDIVSETFLRVWDSTVEVRMETVRGYCLPLRGTCFYTNCGTGGAWLLGYCGCNRRAFRPGRFVGAL